MANRVLVVGKLEESMAPYHRFEATGKDDQYVEEIDHTEDAELLYRTQGSSFASYLEFVKSHFGVKPIYDMAELDLKRQHKYGYVLLKENNVLKVVKRTNPRAQWEWYRVCHTGFLLKDGSRRGTTVKGDIDFENMKREADMTLIDEYLRQQQDLDSLGGGMEAAIQLGASLATLNEIQRKAEMNPFLVEAINGFGFWMDYEVWISMVREGLEIFDDLELFSMVECYTGVDD